MLRPVAPDHRRFPLVDSLRGFAALSIVAYHAVGFYGGALRDDAAVRPYVARLESGVVVFLLISGFLLYRPFVLANLRGGRPDVPAYAWRRALRIVPAYWVALLIGAVVLSLPGVLTPHGVVTYFGFLQIYRASTIGGGDAPAWTIGLELSFYAFLPLWALGMRAVARRRANGVLRLELAGAAFLLVFSVAYKLALFATGAVHAPGTGPLPALVVLPGYLDEFALGMGLAVVAVWLEDRPAPGPIRLIARRPELSWLVALAAFLLAARGIGLTGDPAEHYTAASYLARNLLYGVLALGLLAPAVFGGARGDPLRRALGARPLIWLGLVSYGIYLWHWLVLLQLSDWGLASVTGVHPYLLWGGATAALTIALGAASFYLVERPAMSLRRRRVPAAA
jgi:peptidoglycan/LPS O-acetylase OafA/YrhL